MTAVVVGIAGWSTVAKRHVTSPHLPTLPEVTNCSRAALTLKGAANAANAREAPDLQWLEQRLEHLPQEGPDGFGRRRRSEQVLGGGRRICVMRALQNWFVSIESSKNLYTVYFIYVYI